MEGYISLSRIKRSISSLDSCQTVWTDCGFYYHLVTIYAVMTEWLSEEDMERIARFAESPGYDKNPSMLLPEDREPDDDDSE